MGSPKSTSVTMGGRDAETRAINSSLHTLTRVVAAFATAPPGQRPAHVPFRESLLTLMLRDSIGGNCRTSIIVTLSGDEDQLGHSLKSCHFARLARGVSNCARANKSFDPALALDALRVQVAELTRSLADAEAERDSAAAAAAQAESGSLDGLLACESAAALDAHLRGWVEGALPWDDAEALPAVVRRLAAVADSLRRCVRATSVPTSLDSPSREDAGTGTTPPRAPPASEHAGTQVTPPQPAAVSLTPASPRDASPAGPASAAASVLASGCASASPASRPRSLGGRSLFATSPAKQLSESERLVALRSSAMLLADACDDFAHELEGRALAPARLVRDLALRGGKIDAIAPESSPAGRVRMLEAQVALTRARASEFRAAAAASEHSGHTRAAEPAVTRPVIPPPLGPSSLFTWQIQRDGKGATEDPTAGGTEGGWDSLASSTAALLEASLRSGHGGERSVVVCSGSKAPFLASAPRGSRVGVSVATAAGASAASAPPATAVASLPACLPSPVVCHASLEAAWQQPLGLDGIQPFTFSVLDPEAGVQVCSVSGASRALRRVTPVILRGVLRKRGRRSGAWRQRFFALTPTGIVQINDAVGWLATAAALDPAARGCLVQSSAARTKIAFGTSEVTLAKLAGENCRSSTTEDGEGAHLIVSQRCFGGMGTEWEFAAGSLDEAVRWVEAINAAAEGAYASGFGEYAAQGNGTASLAEGVTSESREREHYVQRLIAAQMRLDQQQQLDLRLAARQSQGPPHIALPLLLGGGSPLQEAERCAGPNAPAEWCGRGPAGISAILPVSAALWRSVGEPLVSEIIVAEGVASLAQTLGYPSYAVLVLAAGQVRNTAAAAAFEIHAKAAAAAGGSVREAYAVAPSRSALHRLISYPGGAPSPPLCAARPSAASSTQYVWGGLQWSDGSLTPRTEIRPDVFANATAALDAHAAQIGAARGLVAGDPQACFGHAASLVAVVVFRAAVGPAAGEPEAEGCLQYSSLLPTRVVWLQVAPGPT